MIGKEEGRNPELISVTPGPFLKNTAPDADSEGAGNNNVFKCVRRGVWCEAMPARAAPTESRQVAKAGSGGPQQGAKASCPGRFRQAAGAG